MQKMSKMTFSHSLPFSFFAICMELIEEAPNFDRMFYF